VLYIAVSIVGWLVPIILLCVTFFATALLGGAVVSVLDGLVNPEAPQTSKS
jgi:hypothetical protein